MAYFWAQIAIVERSLGTGWVMNLPSSFHLWHSLGFQHLLLFGSRLHSFFSTHVHPFVPNRYWMPFPSQSFLATLLIVSNYHVQYSKIKLWVACSAQGGWDCLSQPYNIVERPPFKGLESYPRAWCSGQRVLGRFFMDNEAFWMTLIKWKRQKLCMSPWASQNIFQERIQNLPCLDTQNSFRFILRKGS